MHDFFNLPCLNIIWRLVCGRRFAYDDQALHKLITIIEAFTMEKAIGPMTGIKVLKYIPPFSGIYKNIRGEGINLGEYPDIRQIVVV